MRAGRTALLEAFVTVLSFVPADEFWKAPLYAEVVRADFRLCVRLPIGGETITGAASSALSLKQFSRP